jgi:hypothetical protein
MDPAAPDLVPGTYVRPGVSLLASIALRFLPNGSRSAAFGPWNLRSLCLAGDFTSMPFTPDRCRSARSGPPFCACCLLPRLFSHTSPPLHLSTSLSLSLLPPLPPSTYPSTPHPVCPSFADHPIEPLGESGWSATPHEVRREGQTAREASCKLISPWRARQRDCKQPTTPEEVLRWISGENSCARCRTPENATVIEFVSSAWPTLT